MIILCCTLSESPIQNNHENNFQVHCTHLLVNSVCLHVCTVLLCTYSLVSLCCIKVWWGGLVGDTPCRPHLATASYSFTTLLQSIISIMILLAFFSMETTNDPPIRPIDPIKVQFDNFHMHKIVDQCIHSHCHSKLVLALGTNSWFPTVHWTLGWLDWVCPVAVGVVYKEKLRPAPPSASAGAWGLLQVQVTTDHWCTPPGCDGMSSPLSHCCTPQTWDFSRCNATDFLN